MEEQTLKLGQMVVVNETCKFYDEWKGEAYRVVGVQYDSIGKINVTIAQDAFTGWDNPTDGFPQSELTAV